ncbi:MAG: PAS domain S-box protein, partial [Comamonadaceae bacterium]
MRMPPSFRPRRLLALAGAVLCVSSYAASLPPVGAENGMVVTAQRLASQVGVDVLKKGGNAVDAAVAVGYALAVVYPAAGNLGGGGFMTLQLADGRKTFIDFREKAPLAATPNMYLDKEGNVIKGASTSGHLAVAVPGLLTAGASIASAWFYFMRVPGQPTQQADLIALAFFGLILVVDCLVLHVMNARKALVLAREHELEALTANSPDVLTRFDRGLRHVFVNAAVERITGRPREAFLHRTNRELGMPGPLCDQWEAALLGVFATGESAALEFAFDTAAGKRHFAAQLVPERDEQGQVQYVLGVTRDVTERVQHELLLQQEDRRKDEFLAVLAHELRNPLAPVRTGLTVL